MVLSKERADFLKVWDRIKTAHEAGDVVTGQVDRRIKGGLVVKLWGVDTFLPGSQVALRQVPNLEDMIGEEIQCRIIKKNKRRRNVVVSRRIVLEQERVGMDRVLNAAALTYVAAAIATLAQLLYFLYRAGLLGGRR